MNLMGETGSSRKETYGWCSARKKSGRLPRLRLAFAFRALCLEWRRNGRGRENMPGSSPRPVGWFVGCACQELKTVGQALSGCPSEDSEKGRRPFLVDLLDLVRGLVVDAEESGRGAEHLSYSGISRRRCWWWIDFAEQNQRARRILFSCG